MSETREPTHWTCDPDGEGLVSDIETAIEDGVDALYPDPVPEVMTVYGHRCRQLWADDEDEVWETRMVTVRTVRVADYITVEVPHG